MSRKNDSLPPAQTPIQDHQDGHEDKHAFSFDLGSDDAGNPVRLDLAELMAGRLLVTASSGGGKTWTLRRLIEKTFGHVQQVIVDPEGEFSTLTPTFGHVVMDSAAVEDGYDLARNARKHRVSMILDVSENDRDDQISLVTNFMRGLVEAPRETWHPLLLVIDEVQIFAPWGASGEASDDVRKASVSAMTELMTRGRKRGICPVLGTQRLARLAKSVASEAQNLLIGRSLLDIDVSRSGEHLGWNKKTSVCLRTLRPGQFYAFGPAMAPHPKLVRIGPVVTVHAGSTPTLELPPLHDVAVGLALLQGGEAPIAVASTIEDATSAVGGSAPSDCATNRYAGLDSLTEKERNFALARYHAILPLLGEAPLQPNLDGEPTASRSSLFNWLKKFRTRGQIVDLAQRSRRRSGLGGGTSSDFQNSAVRWTTERKADLDQRCRSGESIREICNGMGLNRSQVSTNAYRFGLTAIWREARAAKRAQSPSLESTGAAERGVDDGKTPDLVGTVNRNTSPDDMAPREDAKNEENTTAGLYHPIDRHIALRRRAIIQPLLECNSVHLRSTAAAVSSQCGYGTRTILRWLSVYLSVGVDGLAPGWCGWKRASRLTPGVVDILRSVLIETISSLAGGQTNICKIHKVVAARCKGANLPAPAESTIREWVEGADRQELKAAAANHDNSSTGSALELIPPVGKRRRARVIPPDRQALVLDDLNVQQHGTVERVAAE